ncbi:MAG: GGDEF domain-containing protein [Fibrobacter sp.]|nr:GGDEF domain-containing protein [Fibrobacter sp.]
MAKGLGANRSRVVIWCIVAILTALALTGLFNYLRSSGIDHDILRLNDGWTVHQNGKVYENQTIDLYQFPDGPLGYRDSITFSKKFVFKGRPPYMFRIRASHSAVRIAVEDWTVFMYGYDLLMARKFIGTGVFSVPLPYDANGRVLNITLYGGYKQELDRTSGFEILSKEVAYTDYMARHSYSLFIGVFLVVLGFLSVVLGLVGYGFNKAAYRIVLIGMLSLLVGLWSMCYARVIQICTLSFVETGLMEYVCLYLIPIPFLLLLQDIHRGKLSPIKWRLLRFATVYAILFAVAAVVLHLTRVAMMSQLVPIFHVSVIVTAIYTVSAGMIYSRKNGTSEKIFALGLLAFFVFAIWDIIRYNLQYYYLFTSNLMNMTWVPFGALLFILALVAAYVVYVFKSVAEKAEKDLLAELAYKDVLTGLFNRTKCEQIFDVLDQENDDFAIISIDMNGLKLVNDTYGHSDGDKQIVAFAEVLQEALNGIGTAARVGGDEFVCIVRSSHLSELHVVKERMDEMTKSRSQNLAVNLEASYGVAFRREVDGGLAKDVYRVADERMYAMKKESKSKLVRH